MIKVQEYLILEDFLALLILLAMLYTLLFSNQDWSKTISKIKKIIYNEIKS
jgi:hypothetical protein